MRYIGTAQRTGRILMLVVLLGWPANGFAQGDSVEGIIETFFVKYEDEAGKNDAQTETAGAVEKLAEQPLAALTVLGEKLSDEKSNRRILSARLLNGLLDKLAVSNTIDGLIHANFSTFETLKKNLVTAFQLNDPELQEPVYSAWKIPFQDENLFEAARQSLPETDYKTPFFFLHAGALRLNPYTITKNQTGEYMLESSGDADTRFFIEALYRNRYAWVGKQPKKNWRALDYEMRLGIAATDSDPSGAVVSGAGDAYMEFSIGYLHRNLGKLGLNNLDTASSEGVRWTFNLESIAGFVTDRGAQDLHFYWGVGPVVVVGIPYAGAKENGKNRRIEVLGGTYFGQTDMPQFVDDDSREVESEKDFPKFRCEAAAIWRGDIHFPFGENGFVTITGRFTSNLGHEGINPWNIAIGYTIPVEAITDSVSTLFKQ